MSQGGPLSTLPKPAAAVTVAEALEALLEVTAQRVADDVRAPATLEMQQAHARWWCGQLGGDRPLDQVDELVLEELASRRRPPRPAHAGARRAWGPATLRKRLSTLRGALELAHRRRRIARMPAFPRVLVRRPPAPAILETYAQARELFEALPLHRAEWFWLALWTGQHASDVERMTWADVSLQGGVRSGPTMLIRNWKNRRREGLRVRVPAPLIEVLRAKWKREAPRMTDPIVRPWPSRKQTLPHHCRKLELPILNATALRHTCLSWVVRHTGITPAACAFAGHSSPEMMARKYAHALPPQANEVIAALDSMADEPSNDNGGI
jgi:integrase